MGRRSAYNFLGQGNELAPFGVSLSQREMTLMGEALARSPYSSPSPKGDATRSLLSRRGTGILRQESSR
ncbi:MAG: hypothetical protein V7L21_11245 [Nostoc sp.]|uniref:hypothetical protein n=1 Tax=Nostoc sp. TaxID=1180 RepID=UPI002FF6DB3C